VQTLCGRRFCHPVTLFYKKSYTAFLKDVLAAAHNGAVTYTAAISDGERLTGVEKFSQNEQIFLILAEFLEWKRFFS